MIKIIHAKDSLQIDHIRMLFQEYADTLEFDLCFQNFDTELKNLPAPYAPPEGCLLLAYEADMPVGCAGIRPLSKTVCEMKRLYVKPQFQNKGIGRCLANAIISKARESGYHQMRLDTVSSMKTAQGLYISLGFYQIDAYCYNPLPGAMYFELPLVPKFQLENERN